MSKRKGGEWVLKLSEEMNKSPITFVMVGGGECPEYIPDNVRFVGLVNDKKELAQYYSLADVFILLSYRETYSMTCAEALCCGTSVIGFKCGAPETVFSTDEATFVEYGNIEEITRILTDIIQKKNL